MSARLNDAQLKWVSFPVRDRCFGVWIAGNIVAGTAPSAPSRSYGIELLGLVSPVLQQATHAIEWR